MMTYGSVCSGIEAASVAWEPLGFKPAFFSEIEAFPRAVLEHRWPEVSLHGDFTTIERGSYGSIDLLVGGTPCQSFSIAGLRKGMADERGNLALEYLRLAQRLSPQWLVWENVPGVLSSNGGRDFGAFLGGLVELGYGFAYRVLDAQYFGVPQRRRRVFVVAYLGDSRAAAAVLFERHSLQGHSAPSQKKRPDVAGTLESRSSAGGFPGTDEACSGHVVAALDASYGRLQGCSGQDMNHGHSHLVANPLPNGACRALTAATTATGRLDPNEQTFVAFSCKDNGRDATEGLAPTLRSMSGEHPNGGGQLAIAFAENSRSELRLEGGDGQQVGTLSTGGGKPGQGIPAIAFRACGQDGFTPGPIAPPVCATDGGGAGVPSILDALRVRRLTPVECERLQGFVDNHTRIPWRGKSAELCPDGPRYKAIGNSMAVPVMHWIGWRIQQVQELKKAA